MTEGTEDRKQDGDWLVEQSYRAVLEALDGSPVAEVARRYGVSRQSVYAWKAKHAAGGFEGLREGSRRPRTRPSRLPAVAEAMICEMRRAIPDGEPAGSPTRSSGPGPSRPRRGPQSTAS